MIQFATSRPTLPRPTESSKPKGESPNLFDGVERSALGLPFEQLQDAELPSCSIIIPVRNRSIFIKACLLAIEKSIRADRLPYEVIVVDNGSSDDTHVFFLLRMVAFAHMRSYAPAIRELRFCPRL